MYMHVMSGWPTNESHLARMMAFNREMMPGLGYISTRDLFKYPK